MKNNIDFETNAVKFAAYIEQKHQQTLPSKDIGRLQLSKLLFEVGELSEAMAKYYWGDEKITGEILDVIQAAYTLLELHKKEFEGEKRNTVNEWVENINDKLKKGGKYYCE